MARATRTSGLNRAIGMWLVLSALGALVVLASAGCGSEDQTAEEQGQKADNAYERLDGAITGSLHQTNVAVQRAYGPLAEASNASPEGGPEVLQCVPGCEQSAASVRRTSARLEDVNRSSPGYLQRIYGDAYAATENVLGVATQYLDALAEWARVHGTTPYSGAAEFEQVKVLRDRLAAANREQIPALREARREWYRYAERRWELEYR